ncbi:DUF1800 domain-containing protein [Sphingomonas sp.]|jgi:uncharacterized protein (DUF1800 family)|uniref:DUF1800 domain-containing protein n=1 Tax=Sphingomonas sp. TaxID=28214 RepID=UPI002E32643F|nr:DUF1800 domain-containing protein [Sphingomonas sp.]HEX4695848.1 DUF1800 domain-containing protein [Sphingomonas sp.]
MADASIALNRFGLGARPDESEPSDPKAWLKRQIETFEPKPAAFAAVPTRAKVAGELADYIEQQRQMRQAGLGRRQQAAAAPAAAPMPGMAPQMASPAMQPGTPEPGAKSDDAGDPLKAARRFIGGQVRDDYATAVGARVTAALTSPTPFAERLAHFWANHFAVSADKLQVIGLSGLLEFEAIRPHLMGKFGDMLNAVERHPAMLLYLDQAQSIGPNSMAGRFIASRPRANGQKAGINENLAREIMELHTLGVRTGYTQADVTEFARALTGWTVGGIGRGPGARLMGTDGTPGDFVFAERLHEPGERTIFGKRYADGGERQAQAVLDTLATSPATAEHVSTKLARHFAGDTPPPALVARLKASFLKTGGDLPSFYRVLIDSPECWVAGPVKFKSPWEWTVSTARALGMRQMLPLAAVGLLNQLGQPTWKPGSPAGYDDIAASWAGPDALVRRVEAAERFATRAGAAIDARALAPKLFPGALTPATEQALARAESPGQGLALLLVSPEMLRR